MPAAPTPARIRASILALLHQRGAGKTICPSEVARSLAGTDDRKKWEPLMDPIRAIAAKMAADSEITATQKGRAIDIATARGPIRLRLGTTIR